MKSLVKVVLLLLKWAVLLIIGLELLAFAIVSISNYIIYGHIRDGSRAIYDPYTLFRSSSGVRHTTSFCPQPGKATKTIWMFGGSTMRGSTENDDATIASYLAKEINELNLNTCWSVVNYGENSYNSLMEVQYLQKELIQNDYQPDIVLFYDGANDCVYFAQHRTAEGHHGYRRAKGLIESYYKSFFGVFKALNAAYYASFTKELHDKLMQVQFDINPSSPEFQEHVKQVGKRYTYVNRISACFGAHFLLFWQPAQWVENQEVMVEVREKESRHFINTERFASMRNNFLTTYEALEHSLTDRPYFVDFRNVLTSRQTVGYMPDGVHLTDTGRELVARGMLQVLLQRGLL